MNLPNSPKFGYAELQVTSNYSFLQSGSHPEEFVATAAHLGYEAIALTDWMTLGGIVRAHTAAKRHNISILIGCALPLFNCNIKDSSDIDATTTNTSNIRNNHEIEWCEKGYFLAYPTSKESYEQLSYFLSLLHRVAISPCNDDNLIISLHKLSDEFIFIIPFIFLDPNSLFYNKRVEEAVLNIKNFSNSIDLYIGVTRYFTSRDDDLIVNAKRFSEKLEVPLVVTNDAKYHIPECKIILDTLTCVRLKTTLQEAGTKLLANSERYLKSIGEIYRLFRDIPDAVAQTVKIAERISKFSLDQLTYEYPEISIEDGRSQLDELIKRVYEGAKERFPEGIPTKIEQTIEDELNLIHQLKYEKYFLTCHEIVLFARQRSILCQGRGAAANSVVCYCLGLTAVNPLNIDLLFGRFVSKEREEPPDIDIDFEHERREEVIQFIYERFGRDHAALTAEIITYRHKSALNDIGKVFGLDQATISQIAKSSRRWSSSKIEPQFLIEAGLDPDNIRIKTTLELIPLITGFPRHRSQHVGGFIISKRPLNRIVPIIPATMQGRSIVEWDKDDIEELGILKIDILALGMLTCLSRAFYLVNQSREISNLPPLALYTIPDDDQETYDMISRSDTIGVFQIESRAQMSMLPRLRPKCYYDLVIQVAIVRPGPIHGDMVHPYLRRRFGKETIVFPDDKVKSILGKTLGVPLFQEQAMRLAISLAGFSPGEAEQLRRAMAAWKRHEDLIQRFKDRIIKGMTEHGYSLQFAQTCMNQIKGFSEYGFPESHAASFAIIVLASAWIKKHYPAQFCVSLLNSQPMGFYAPAQIIKDAQNHGVEIEAIDINYSDWETTINIKDSPKNMNKKGVVRLGMHLVKGLERRQGELIALIIKAFGPMSTIQELWRAAYNISSGIRLKKDTLVKLAQANGFKSLGLNEREALWEIRGLMSQPTPFLESDDHSGRSQLPNSTLSRDVALDYATTGFSLRAHPVSLIRETLTKKYRARTWENISNDQTIKLGSLITICGLVIVRQRPETSKGVVFLSIEDETGIINVIISPPTFDKYAREIMNESVLIVRGNYRNIGPVIYCVAKDIEAISLN